MATPGEAWYGLALLPLIALTGSWQWLGVFAGEYVGYLTALLGGPHLPASQASYLSGLILGVGVTALRALRGRLERAPMPTLPGADRGGPA